MHFVDWVKKRFAGVIEGDPARYHIRFIGDFAYFRQLLLNVLCSRFFVAAVSVDLTGSQRGLQLPEFIFAQLDVPCPEVFQNTVLILGTGDRNNVRVFMQHFEHRVFTGVFMGVQISVRASQSQREQI